MPFDPNPDLLLPEDDEEKQRRAAQLPNLPPLPPGAGEQTGVQVFPLPVGGQQSAPLPPTNAGLSSDVTDQMRGAVKDAATPPLPPPSEGVSSLPALQSPQTEALVPSERLRDALTVQAASPRPPLPLSVSDRVGPMPSYSDSRYHTDDMGRLRAGWENFKVGPPVQAVGSTPGERMGSAIGGLIGRFGSGVLSPAVVGQNRYKRDLDRWQQGEKAASDAATQEAQRAHLIAESTHENPYTGNPDLFYQSLYDHRASEDESRAKTADASMLRAQATMGHLKTQTQANLLKALESGAFTPTEDEKNELAMNGITFIGKQAGSGVSLVRIKGQDGMGRPTESDYYFDKNAKQLMPVTIGMGSVGIGQSPQQGVSAAPLGTAATQPATNQVTSPPATFTTSPAKGELDPNRFNYYKGFRKREDLDREFEADQDRYKALISDYVGRRRFAEDQANREQSGDDEGDKKGPNSSTLYEKMLDARKKMLEAAAEIKAKYPAGYVETGEGVAAPGDSFPFPYIKNYPDRLPTEKKGMPPPIIPTTQYPMPGGEETRKTGKLPRGVIVGPGTMLPR